MGYCPSQDWDRYCDDTDEAMEYHEQLALGTLVLVTCIEHPACTYPRDFADCAECMRAADEAEYQHWQDMERLRQEPPGCGAVDQMMDDYHYAASDFAYDAARERRVR